MDNQTQSFLELSAMNDLVQLAADKRAAWLWSADGAKVLWSNAAGAAFFSAQTVSDLAGLSALERSPARPHIARIAESGLKDRFSIDRLRFYRGLRVMLLTCQCKKVELPGGETAALIVCSDKGLALTRDPLPAFAHLLRSPDCTVFLIAEGSADETFGALAGLPEDIPLPQGQKVLFGPLDLGGQLHDGAVLQIPAGPRIVVLNDTPMSDADEDAAEKIETGDGPALAPSPVVSPELQPEIADGTPDEDLPSSHDSGTSTTQNEDPDVETPAEELSNLAESSENTEVPVNEADQVAEPEAVAEENGADQVDEDMTDILEPAPLEMENQTPVDEDAHTTPEEDTPSEESETPETRADGDDAATAAEDAKEHDAAIEEAFVFQPRRRPVRFAWKMDVDQCFTFLSDEFTEVLGPDATNIVGFSWAEVSEKFGLDPRGNIARALDRRDTWSGKTVAWPVSGAALRVPVDMAALPAFDRDRKFEGYRGFGVCRTSDAVQDPDGFIPAPVSAALADDPEVENADDDLETDSAEAEQPIEEMSEDVDGTPDAEAQDVETVDTSFKDEDAAVGEMDGDDLVDDASDDSEGDLAETDHDVTAEGDNDADIEPEDKHIVDEDGDAVPDEVASEKNEDDTVPEAEEDAPVVEANENQELKDLKPAQPNSLGGRTFLGASAAALVGSLAMFKGKKGTKSSDPVSEPTAPSPEDATTKAEQPEPASNVNDIGDTDTADSLDLSEDLKNAAAALNADIGEDAPEADHILPETEAEDATSDLGAVAETEDLEDADVSSEPDVQADTAIVAGEADEEDEEPAEEAEDPTAEQDASVEPQETEEDYKHENGSYIAEVAVNEHAEEDAAETERTTEEATEQEPVGIAGPAELKPSEIESAVKTLAKSYKPVERQAPDLFDDEREEQSAGSTATDETGSEVEELDFTTEDQSVEAPDTPKPDIETEAEDTILDNEIDESASSEVGEDPAAEEEREFFEETAAFEQEERAAEAETSTDEGPEAERKTGEVIPLATARPRVVPVDTSSLSRPERQAFRKIAEALGARLEGDLEDFDAPDPEEEENLDDLPPEVPEAGPIDPSLLDRLPIGISIVHDREVLYANKALLKMLGYTTIAALSEAGGLEALFIDDTDELADGIGVDDEVDEAMKMRLADGGVLTVDAHMHSVPWNGTRGLMISITERQQKQNQPSSAPASPNFFAGVRAELDSARDQIAELDTILETATDGVLVLDQHGTIVKVNGSAEALFSANRADMIGAPLVEFLAPESHRAATDYLDGLSRNGVASILNDGREVLGQVPAGGLIPLFMTMGRITSSDGEAKFCAVLRDITQWKTAEEELTEAKRQAENASSQKSDFLAKISHEIRTPLNAIIGFSEVMMEERFGAIGNDRYKDYLKDIRTSGSHIMSLINDLLDLSKIEAGKLDLKFTAVSTNEVINECVALMQPQANRERVIIRASLPESVPDIVADPRSLRQIVLNLLSNGIKYNKSGGQVILSTALESNGEVALRVRDTGTGMTAKQLTAALEPFRQLHTSSRGGGTGLGLPLTKALVEANRASFHIDSTPDQGTLVEIVFPTQRVLSE